MKTIETLIAEIAGSKELKAAYEKAVETGKLAEFLKENGCDATAETWVGFMKELAGKDDSALSLDEMDKMAGGTGNLMDIVKKNIPTDKVLEDIISLGLKFDLCICRQNPVQSPDFTVTDGMPNPFAGNTSGK